MTAHSAILQALYDRKTTGAGTGIQVSLFDAVADWMNVPVLQHDYSGYQTLRGGVSHPSLTPYGAYRCSDGKDVIFSVQNDREWVNFCRDVLKQPELTRAPGFADNMERLGNRAALNEIVQRRFAELSSAEAMRELELAGLAYGRLNDIGDVSSHPHVRRVAVDTPGGSVNLIAPAATYNEMHPELRSVPALGAHTQAIRQEFGARKRA
jgi:crotonobetainyl-CoA:carnitine CoA-transferase CaiB-like acyl-CoA transferase